MIDTSHLIVFLIATISLNLTPGPDLIYVATRSIGNGRVSGVISSLGIGTGCLVHTAAATLGLSALFIYSATAFAIVKYVGAAYLIYLGIKSIRSRVSLIGNARAVNLTNWQMFRQGMLTNVLNPKVALFFLSFLPQFVNPSTGSVKLQFATLGLIFVTSGTIVCIMVGLLCGYLSERWLNRPSVLRVQRWFTGSIFIGLGVRLALSDNR